MKTYWKYQLVKFGGYFALKKVHYENDRPVRIEDTEGSDFALQQARNDKKLDSADYGWKDER